MASENSTKALLQGKCPRCHKGDVFVYPLTKFTKFSKMHRECPHCRATFESEPGFYFGAMFISYAFNVAIFIACWLVLYLTINPSDWVYVVAIAVAAIVMTPLNFRLSRIIWLYWFGGLRFDETL